MRKAIIAAALLFCFSGIASRAQESRFIAGYHKFDNAIREFLMGGLDTTYITLPSKSFEIPVVMNNYGYNTTVTPAGSAEPMPFNSGNVTNYGIGIGYHGLDYVQNFISDDNLKATQFIFNLYDNAWGIGINYGNSRFDTGEAVRSIIIDGYIALNGTKYSYPSAIYANYIQKKSAGSPLVTFWYANRQFTGPITGVFGENGVELTQTGGLTAGYGYNLAIAGGRAVINASACAGVLLPHPGLAAHAKIGTVIWLSDSVRLNAIINYFNEYSTSPKDLELKAQTWFSQVGVAYCF